MRGRVDELESEGEDGSDCQFPERAPDENVMWEDESAVCVCRAASRWLSMYAFLICIAEKTNIVVTFFAPSIMRERRMLDSSSQFPALLHDWTQGTCPTFRLVRGVAGNRAARDHTRSYTH